MGRTLTYPKTKIPNSTINRYDSRGKYFDGPLTASFIRSILNSPPGTYDLETIHNIINTTSVLHVSFSPGPEDPFPAILPMIGVMGSYAYPSSSMSEPQDCYLHGYVSSRIMRLASQSQSTSPGPSGEPTPAGIPVCIAATKVDGLVLSLTPNSHSYNYRSAILHGHASVVTDPAEKHYAMRLVTNSVIPSRYENTRNPPDGAEMASTNILRVSIVSGSGKIREGGPHDDKKDLERDDVTGSTWTGVVPVFETLGTPVASATNRVNDVPAYLREYLEETTGENERYAGEAARKP